MPPADHALGGRLPLFFPDDLPHSQQKLYNQLDDTLAEWAKKPGFEAKTPDAQLIGPFNAMLRSPRVSQGMLELLETETKHTTLNERVRQVIRLVPHQGLVAG